MNSKIKWWLNGIAAFIFVLLCAIYLLIRPIIVQNLEPVLKEQLGGRVNGTLSWQAMDLDPELNLSFTKLELKDENGADVLSAPTLTVGWTMSSLYNYLINNAGVASVVKDVTVEDPELSLAQKADGTWNVSTILKPSESSDSGAFTGKVIISNGTAKVNTAKAGEMPLSALNGSFAWDENSRITGGLKGNFLDSAFKSSLDYKDSGHMEINVSTDPIPLKSLQPLLDAFPQLQNQLTLDNGTGKVTDAKIWKSDGAVAYRVTGSFNHAALSYDNYVLADGAAFFNIENGVVSLSRVSTLVNGQKLTGDVSVDTNAESPVFQGSVFLHQVDVGALLPDYNVSGILDGNLDFAGTMDNPSVSGALTGEGLSYEGYDVKRAKAVFAYHDDKLTVSHLEADRDGGHLEGRASYDRMGGDFSVSLLADNVNLDGLPVNSPVTGTVSGYGLAEGNYLNGSLSLKKASASMEGSNLSYDNMAAGNLSGFGSYDGSSWQVTALGSGISYDGMSFDSLSFSAENRDGVITVPYLSGAGEEGFFTGKGYYSDNGMNFDVEISDMNLAPFSSYAGVDLGGRVWAKAHVTGTPDKPEGTFDFRAGNGYVKNAVFDSVEGHAVLAGDRAAISSLAWDGPSGHHSISGTIGISAPHDMNLSVKTKETRIETLLSLAGLDYPVTGWISNDLSLTGTVDHPVVSGDFHAWSGSVMGELFQSISGKYSYDGQDVTLENCLGYIYDGTALVNGKIRGKDLELETSLTDVSIERILPGKGIEGTLSLLGHVRGTTDSPVFDGMASTRQITIAGNTIRNVSAGIHYKDGLISLDEGSFRQKQGSFTWKGSYNTNSGALDGFLKFDSWNIKDIMRFFNKDVDGVDGQVEGSMRISGTTDSPNVNFNAHVLGGHLGSAVLGEGKVDFSYMNGALSIRECRIPIGSGVLAAQGSMNSAGDLDIQAAAKDMDISWIPQVLGKRDVSIGGNLTAAIILSGNKKAPVADISVGLTNPRYGDITFDSLSLMANAANNVVTVQNGLISRGQYRASMKGTLPGNVFTGSTTDKAVPLNLDINLDEADMNMLAIFFKPVTAASGPIHGHVTVAGSYDNPLLLGGINVKDGSLSLMTMNEAISPINMNLSFSGNESHLEGSAAFGGGSLTVNGDVSWDHMKIGNYKGELHIHTPSINSTYYKGALDGDFTFGEIERFEKPGISGTLKAENAVVDIPFTLLGDSGGTSLDMLAKIDVTIGNNVRLYNSALYDMMVKGNLAIRGPVSAPFVTGRVNAEKGTVKINTTEFKMNEANASWSGEPGNLLPDVYAKAFTKVGHYAVTAELDGPPGNMKTTFHSEPALNDTQILMLLTLHQSPDAKDNNGAMEGALFNAGLTMLFGNGIQDFLQDKIGLDQISITSSLTDYYDNMDDNNDSYYYIKIGKYIFNDFMLTATMGMNNDEKSIGAHYDLNSRVGLSSWYNSNHDSYVGTDWSFKF